MIPQKEGLLLSWLVEAYYADLHSLASTSHAVEPLLMEATPDGSPERKAIWSMSW